VFPLLPVVVGGAAQAHHRVGPIVMAAGMVSAFVSVGVALAALGPLLGIGSAHVRSAAGVLMVLAAVAMLRPRFGGHTSRFLSTLAGAAERIASRLQPESLTGAFVLGGLLGAVWSPCSGPLLGSGIALVASEGGLFAGALILGTFGVGAALPLVCAAYCSRALYARVRNWVSAHSASMRSALGALMLLMGLAVLSGADRWIEAGLVARMPTWWLELAARY
jgi:cytochrome c biogenesis protein CcdA